jgi:hypothetical protein
VMTSVGSIKREETTRMNCFQSNCGEIKHFQELFDFLELQNLVIDIYTSRKGGD